MSQAKVDRYKEEKKNRQQIMKKEKRDWMMTKLLGAVVGVVLAGWVGISAYQAIKGPKPAETAAVTEVEEYTVDTSALGDYLSALENN